MSDPAKKKDKAVKAEKSDKKSVDRPERLLPIDDKLALLVGRQTRHLAQVARAFTTNIFWAHDEDGTPHLSIETGYRVEDVRAFLRVSSRDSRKDKLEIGVQMEDKVYVPITQEKTGGMDSVTFLTYVAKDGYKKMLKDMMTECRKAGKDAAGSDDSADDSDEDGDSSVCVETDDGTSLDGDENDDDNYNEDDELVEDDSEDVLSSDLSSEDGNEKEKKKEGKSEKNIPAKKRSRPEDADVETGPPPPKARRKQEAKEDVKEEVKEEVKEKVKEEVKEEVKEKVKEKPVPVEKKKESSSSDDSDESSEKSDSSESSDSSDDSTSNDDDSSSDDSDDSSESSSDDDSSSENMNSID